MSPYVLCKECMKEAELVITQDDPYDQFDRFIWLEHECSVCGEFTLTIASRVLEIRRYG